MMSTIDPLDNLRTLPHKVSETSQAASEFRTFLHFVEHLQSANIATSVDTFSSEIHAMFLSHENAYSLIERGDIKCPIFVSNDQAYAWPPGTSAVDQLCEYFPSIRHEVEVQRGWREGEKASGPGTIKNIKTVLRKWGGVNFPVKVVRAQSPLPPLTLPKFLGGPKAAVLPQCLDSMKETPTTLTTSNSWFTLSTQITISTPHMEPHGLGSWMTCQQGQIGLAWLHRPSQKQVDELILDPHNFHEGEEWRFHVLKEGDTVYMEPGTIFFEFSMSEPGSPTLSLGGYILRRPSLNKWLHAVEEQTRLGLNQSMSGELPQFLLNGPTSSVNLAETKALLRAAFELFDAAQISDLQSGQVEDQMIRTQLKHKIQAALQLIEQAEAVTQDQNPPHPKSEQVQGDEMTVIKDEEHEGRIEAPENIKEQQDENMDIDVGEVSIAQPDDEADIHHHRLASDSIENTSAVDRSNLNISTPRKQPVRSTRNRNPLQNDKTFQDRDKARLRREKKKKAQKQTKPSANSENENFLLSSSPIASSPPIQQANGGSSPIIDSELPGDDSEDVQMTAGQAAIRQRVGETDWDALERSTRERGTAASRAVPSKRKRE